MKNTNSCKSKDDLREYEKFNVAHKMLNVEVAKYKVESGKNNNIVYRHEFWRRFNVILNLVPRFPRYHHPVII